VAAVVALVVPVLFFVPVAQAAFGFQAGSAGFAASITEEGVTPDSHAGTHPFAMGLSFALNRSSTLSEGDLRDLAITLPSGLLANPAAVDECTQVQFHTPRVSPFEASLSGESCPDSSQVGVATVTAGSTKRTFGVYNLVSPFGSVETIGFSPFGIPIELDGQIREPDSALKFTLENLSEALNISAVQMTIWGTPLDQGHDELRGNCLNETEPASSWGKCAASSSLSPTPQSYLTLPSSCGGPLRFEATGSSWQQQNVEVSALAETPGGLQGCVKPLSVMKVQLQTEKAASGTGLVFTIDVNDGGGFLNPAGIVRSPIQRAVVALPEGLTVNPSVGAGLGVCSTADFAREAAATPPGSGCPNASKIGEVSIQGLLGLTEPVQGSLFLARPYENPDGALIGLYIVASSPRRGLFFHGAGELVPDPSTGRLVATFEGLPQVHYTHFSLSLREGQRAVMVSPPACGEYATQLELTPYSDPSLRLHDNSPLIISHGEDGGPCPADSVRPFSPALQGGSLNTQAGAYTTFLLHLTRTDADQEITSYSASLPPGLLGKLAGVPECSDTQIEAAKTNSATAELEHSSCPPASEIGHTITGYGVGATLAYAPGRLYLAGPYHGAPLSVVAVDSALVGPFDLGVIVVRSAIRIDPHTAQASIDSAGSDPIPHIIDGIPLHLRDIRVVIDRPGFIVNPTSCDPLNLTSTLTGAGAEPFSSVQDTSVTVPERFQVSNCGALGFKPKFSVSISGKASRANGVSLNAKLTYPQNQGEANIARVKVDLPPGLPSRLTTLQQACTAQTFETNPAACPPASRVGTATATTPILSQTLSGPVFFVSHGGEAFPDLVIVLQGDSFTINLLGSTFIDEKTGITSTTFQTIPDVPVGTFEIHLPQGPYSALATNTNPCKTTDGLAMPTEFKSQNGIEIHQSTPIEVTGCPLAILSHTLHNRNLTVKVYAPSAGKLKVSGRGLATASGTVKGAGTLTLTVHVKRGGKFKTKLNLTFTPSRGKRQSTSTSLRA
jgi:hypothetical protein